MNSTSNVPVVNSRGCQSETTSGKACASPRYQDCPSVDCKGYGVQNSNAETYVIVAEESLSTVTSVLDFPYLVSDWSRCRNTNEHTTEPSKTRSTIVASVRPTVFPPVVFAEASVNRICAAVSAGRGYTGRILGLPCQSLRVVPGRTRRSLP